MELNLMQIKEEELHQLDNVLSIFKHLNKHIVELKSPICKLR